MLNVSFVPTFLKKCLQNVLVNIGFRSHTITLSNPWCLHHALRKSFAVSNAVAVPTINTICINLLNRSTIRKMALYPCDTNKLMMKSINTLCHGCWAFLYEECPKHHGHKGDPGFMPATCGTIGKRAQVILVWVRAPCVENTSHQQLKS